METEKPNKHPKYGDIKGGYTKRSNGCKRRVQDVKRCLSFIKRHGPGYGMTGCYYRKGRYRWYSHHVKFFKVQASRKIRRTADISNGCLYKKVYNYCNIVY